MTDSPTSSPSKEPTFSPTLEPLECPPNLPGSLELCESGFEGCAFDGTLYYAIVSESSPGANDGLLCARVEMPDHDGWIGFGFSADGSMTGPSSPTTKAVVGVLGDGLSSLATTAVVGVPGAGTVLKYMLNAKDKNVVAVMGAAQQTLRDTSVEVNAKRTAIMTFTKRLKEKGEVEILESGVNFFVAAKVRPRPCYVRLSLSNLNCLARAGSISWARITLLMAMGQTVDSEIFRRTFLWMYPLHRPQTHRQLW